MKLVYSEEAERCIARENAAWTAYADYPLLFEEELETAIAAIQNSPDRPVYAMTRRGPVRRMLMPKTGHHVYFIHTRATHTIEIVSVSGGKRKKGPSFDE